MSPFSKLSRPTLLNLATALETYRLQPPFSTLNFSQTVSPTYQTEIVAELKRISEEGMSVQHIAYLLSSSCWRKRTNSIYARSRGISVDWNFNQSNATDKVGNFTLNARLNDSHLPF